MDNKEYLGKGWSFPPIFSKNENSITSEMVSAEEDIRQSIAILLSTHVGERYLVPKFGCNLENFQFRGMTNALRLHIKGIVAEAIKENEPRVKLNDVILDSSEILDGRLRIDVRYTVNKTGSKDSLVYPYYLA